jgi:hypothetical protein
MKDQPETLVIEGVRVRFDPDQDGFSDATIEQTKLATRTIYSEFLVRSVDSKQTAIDVAKKLIPAQTGALQLHPCRLRLWSS